MSHFSPLLRGMPLLYFQAPLVQAIGLKEAIVLQQVHAWLQPVARPLVKGGKAWVPYRFERWWAAFPFWSERTLYRVLQRLEAQVLLWADKTAEEAASWKLVTLNYEALYALLKERTLGQDVSRCQEEEEVFAQEAWPLCQLPERALSFEGLVPYEEGRSSPSFSEISPCLQAVCQNGRHRPVKVAEMENASVKMTEKGAVSAKMADRFNEYNKYNNNYNNKYIYNILPPLPPQEERSCQKNSCPPPSCHNLPSESRTLLSTSFPLTTCPREDSESLRADKQPSSVVEAMVESWNRHVQAQLASPLPVRVTVPRSRKLLTLFQELFNANLQAWESYCRSIARQGFLMGRPENPSGFRVSFDWALEPANALKVLEGAFYDKRALPPATSPDPATSLGGAQAALDRSSAGRRPDGSSTNGSMPGGSMSDTTRPGRSPSSESLSEGQGLKEKDLAQQEPTRQEPAWQEPVPQLPSAMSTAPLAESAAPYAPTPDRPTGDRQAWNRQPWNRQACGNQASDSPDKGTPSMPPVPPEVAAWAAVRAYLEARTTPAVYASWLHPLIQKALQGAHSQDAAIQGHASQGAALKGGPFHNLTAGGTELILAAPTPFQRDYVQAHYGALLLEAVQTVSPRIQRVRLKAGDRL